MKATWNTIAVGLVVIVVLALYMGWAKPVQTEDTMSSLLAFIQDAAQAEDWDRATALNERLSDVWKQERLRVAINHAEQSFDSFEATLSRLKGGVMAQDKVTAVTEATAALETWSNTLRRLVPLP